jgi:hypothetical protein
MSETIPTRLDKIRNGYLEIFSKLKEGKLPAEEKKTFQRVGKRAR